VELTIVGLVWYQKTAIFYQVKTRRLTWAIVRVHPHQEIQGSRQRTSVVELKIKTYGSVGMNVQGLGWKLDIIYRKRVLLWMKI